ncbi:Jem1p NDAI_0G05640 [Naumovozyma dairenensis CBS 421]|uniref:J domain-containing protein n=1 Tax=Naumovozyma dairenensis (strain ATCC 10597 / BCRC 20456 / CBS 421 / NBRC 0211 / NRRL Y-12639) TaxID=1071378 RepID=J7RTI2_NAUDC|nr:hypothetical protein NDAI_0G05640 [Naumovozyma dairenensis CBS 421]CCK73547.1 hypothetical protein NDAI_0G05640 [Naumovozyma dairenensis CBS 421]
MMAVLYYFGLYSILMIFSTISLALSETSCNPEYFKEQIKDLKLDTKSLSQYDQLISEITHCLDIDDEDKTNHQELLALINKLHYNSGIIQLSVGHDQKAIQNFEKITEKTISTYQDSYTTLASKRLNTLYIQYGAWDRLHHNDQLLSEDDKDNFENFKTLNTTLYQDRNIYDEESFINTLASMLEISPYDFELILAYTQVLLRKLSYDIDNVSIALQILKNYEILLQKNAKQLNMSQKLSIHYYSSIIQLFILNSEPTHLRKCLSIDMDNKLCRDLTLFYNRISKINPKKSQILDPQVYSTLSSDLINWNKIEDFYFNDKKPCIKWTTEPKKEFQNNYIQIEQFIIETLNKLFKQEIPNSLQPSSQLSIPPITIPDHYETTDFIKYIDSILCQSSTTTSSSSKKKSKTASFCKKALKESLTEIQFKEYKEILSKNGNGLSIEFLKNSWNSYPQVTMYMINSILRQNKKPSNELIEILFKFFHDEKLMNSSNEYVKKQFDHVNRLNEKLKQAKYQQHFNQQQQQRQQQQQQWNFYQQHQQQQQQQQQQGQAIATDKDYYKIMGLSKDAAAKDIRKTYLSLTKKFHPDKQGQLSEKEQKKNQEKMSAINEAYEVLSDENKGKNMI